MKRELSKSVISHLLEQGFVGKWPHFRRIHTNYIELLTFQLNKYGGSFIVEISAVFPNCNKKNYIEREDLALAEITVWDTSHRYRLKGMYDGWFYYRDLYKKRLAFFHTHYLDVNEKEEDKFIPPKGYRLVQHFNTETAEVICHSVNFQLKQGFIWMERFVKRNLRLL